MSLVLQEINKQYIATNNGLEQVYQNRLIEGVDFERYDWLKGDGNAWIDTLINGSSPLNYKCEIKVDVVPSSITRIIGFRVSTSSSIPQACFSIVNSDIAMYFNSDNRTAESVIVGEIYHLAVNGNVMTSNTQSLTSSIRMVTNKTISLFNYISSDYARSIFNGYMRGVVINGHIFTPIKLLRPCPPNLSSQNKLHPIGECGMIDSVSGKFYGNANTTGSFSVYNDPVTE